MDAANATARPPYLVFLAIEIASGGRELGRTATGILPRDDDKLKTCLFSYDLPRTVECSDRLNSFDIIVFLVSGRAEQSFLSTGPVLYGLRSYFLVPFWFQISSLFVQPSTKSIQKTELSSSIKVRICGKELLRTRGSVASITRSQSVHPSVQPVWTVQ